jgi:hypothetical protein
MKRILVEKWKTLRLYCDRNNFPLDGVIGEIIGAILFIILIWWWLS